MEANRKFSLPEDDETYLLGSGLSWETVLDQNTQWVLIHGFPVPAGYNSALVTLALEIPAGYPDSQIDMVYFSPHLSLTSQKPIKALAERSILSNSYQRWSRHRTAENTWRPGLDNIGTHIELVKVWLEKEANA